MTAQRNARVSLIAAGLAVGIGATLLVGTDTAHAVTVNPVPRQSSRVFVVGDSLTVGAAPYLRRHLRGHIRTLAIDAQVGRFTQQGIAKLHGAQARTANIWVVALGTNDGPSPAIMRKYVSRVMALAGKRQVIWVNVVRPGGYGGVNVMLHQLDVRYQNLTTVDWASFIRRNRSLLSGDRVHLTSRGYNQRALVITKSVDGLLS